MLFWVLINWYSQKCRDFDPNRISCVNITCNVVYDSDCLPFPIVNIKLGIIPTKRGWIYTRSKRFPRSSHLIDPFRFLTGNKRRSASPGRVPWLSKNEKISLLIYSRNRDLAVRPSSLPFLDHACIDSEEYVIAANFYSDVGPTFRDRYFCHTAAIRS